MAISYMDYTDACMEDFYEEWNKRLIDCGVTCQATIYKILKQELYNSLIMKNEWHTCMYKDKSEQPIEGLTEILESICAFAR